ncbi:MFS transporter [Butyrivibrio sp. LB2008]|uniref:MFS transporter n=1 Tax=Butyrivibrio sp. LB2008 TaxID=1408305 RepID=UPI00047BB432|nr:MFS transporter [Butyrivibrio sp. LB2008]
MERKKRFQRFMVINGSQAVSLIGSGLTDFALFFYILKSTMENNAGISQYTILYFFMYIPGIIVAPFIGSLIDRSNKKHVIIGSDSIAALGSLVVMILFNIGMLNRFIVYAVVLVKAVCSAFQAPTFQAGISVLVDKQDYGKAVGLANVGESINKIISPLLGGMLFYSTSLGTIIVIDLICYFIALVLILPCNFGEQGRNKGDDKAEFFRDCKLGFEVILKDKMIVSLLILFIFNNFFISFIEIIVQPLVYILNQQNGMVISNSLALGMVMTCGGVGMMISSIIMGIKGVPENRILSMLTLNAVGGLILMVVIAVKSVFIFAIGTLAYFLTIPIILGANITIWQERIPIQHQGKVFSIRRACVLGITPVSSLLAGWIGDGISGRYESSVLLKKLLDSPDGIYGLMFTVIGMITILISVIFAFNRNLEVSKIEDREVA